MKKLLLTALSAALMAVSANAYELSASPVKAIPENKQLPKAVSAVAERPAQQSRAEDGFTLRFCGDIYSWYGVSQTQTYDMVQYIAIPAEIATQLAGNKLTTITYSICLGNNASSLSFINGTIFVTEDIDGEYLSTKSVRIKDAYSLYQSGKSPYQTGTFDEENQYEIKENTPFYFGIKFKAEKNTYPLGVDSKAATSFAGYADLYQNSQKVRTIDVAQEVGLNLFLFARTVGEKTGLENLFQVEGATMGDFTLPIFNNDGALPIYVGINNMGANALTSIEYSYSFNDGESHSVAAEIDFPPVTEDMIAIEFDEYPVGHNVMRLSIDKINGIEVNEVRNLQFLNLGAAEGFERKFVVEEGTGTWCGYCPRGIVGLDYMSTTYPDTFIGIAVHSGGSDKMAVNTYAPFVQEFFEGFPECVVNRDRVFLIDPNAEYLQLVYEYWQSQLAPVAVGLEVTRNEENTELTAEAKMDFAIDENAEYKVAFVILEDGIIGKQTNYYAGGSMGECGGWESMGSTVTWEYEHTARGIFDTFGIDGSVPTEITAGQTYKYSMPLNLETVEDLEETSIVALVLDAATGTIVNAAKVAYADYKVADGSGIESICGNAGAAEYYNIQGVKVANPRQGEIYIRLQDGKASKIVK